MELFLWVSNIIIQIISAIVKFFDLVGIRIPGTAVLQSKFILRKAQLAYNVSKDESQPLFQKIVVITG
jgi:hypothetical protein